MSEGTLSVSFREGTEFLGGIRPPVPPKDDLWKGHLFPMTSFEYFPWISYVTSRVLSDEMSGSQMAEWEIPLCNSHVSHLPYVVMIPNHVDFCNSSND
jgi:hypothetical protein